jgi:hypothetical protein
MGIIALVQINFFGSANLDSIREHQRARFANPVPETLTKRALFGRFSFEACAATFCPAIWTAPERPTNLFSASRPGFNGISSLSRQNALRRPNLDSSGAS